MSKVHTIHGAEITNTGARTDVLETLREVLALAEKGEIEAVAVLTVSPGKTFRTFWCGSKHMLTAASVHFQYDMTSR